jgi:hypothetical protein
MKGLILLGVLALVALALPPATVPAASLLLPAAIGLAF